MSDSIRKIYGSEWDKMLSRYNWRIGLSDERDSSAVDAPVGDAYIPPHGKSDKRTEVLDGETKRPGRGSIHGNMKIKLIGEKPEGRLVSESFGQRRNAYVRAVMNLTKKEFIEDECAYAPALVYAGKWYQNLAKDSVERDSEAEWLRNLMIVDGLPTQERAFLKTAYCYLLCEVYSPKSKDQSHELKKLVEMIFSEETSQEGRMALMSALDRIQNIILYRNRTENILYIEGGYEVAERAWGNSHYRNYRVDNYVMEKAAERFEMSEGYSDVGAVVGRLLEQVRDSEEGTVDFFAADILLDRFVGLGADEFIEIQSARMLADISNRAVEAVRVSSSVDSIKEIAGSFRRISDWLVRVEDVSKAASFLIDFKTDGDPLKSSFAQWATSKALVGGFEEALSGDDVERKRASAEMIRMIIERSEPYEDADSIAELARILREETVAKDVLHDEFDGAYAALHKYLGYGLGRDREMSDLLTMAATPGLSARSMLSLRRAILLFKVYK